MSVSQTDSCWFVFFFFFFLILMVLFCSWTISVCLRKKEGSNWGRRGGQTENMTKKKCPCLRREKILSVCVCVSELCVCVCEGAAVDAPRQCRSENCSPFILSVCSLVWVQEMFHPFHGTNQWWTTDSDSPTGHHQWCLQLSTVNVLHVML